MDIDTRQPSIEGLDRLTLVGRGGSATVWSAYQAAFDRVVAVKVLHAAPDRSVSQRFLRELQAMARLSDHPNVVAVFHSGLTSTGEPYLVMPFLREGSLQDAVHHRGRLELEEVLRLGVKLCGALESAHRLSVVHGDVKPSNVLFTSYGEPLLGDFGTASLLDRSGAETGDVVGLTPRYAAPEVIEGAAAAPPADVFSLALTLAVALGEQPWDETASLVETVRQRLGGVELSDHLPAEVRGILGPALAVEPADRPGAGEFGDVLRDLQRTLGHPSTSLVVTGRQDEAVADRPVDIDLTAPTIAGPVATGAAPPGSAAGPPPPPPPPLDDATLYPTAPGAGFPPAGPPTAPPPASWGEPIAAPGSRAGGRATGSVLRPIGLVLASPVVVVAALLRALGRALRRRREPTGVPPPSADLRGDESADASAGRLSALVADRPTVHDLLDNEPLVEGLARVLHDPGTSLPLTIAVTGRWGSGKSSVMLQLQQRLLDPPPDGRFWIPVWFDVWRFQGREQLWSGLARAAYRQGLARLPTRRERLWVRFDLVRRRHGLARTVLGVAVLAAVVGWISVQLRTALADADWSVLAGLGALLTAIAAATSLVGGLRDPFQRSLALSSFTRRYESTLGLSEQAERDIDHLVDALTSRRDRGALVVFLDDLDRCEPDVIQRALVTVSEVFGRGAGDRIAFVLGLDLDIVTSVVESGLRDVRTSLSAINPDRSGPLGPPFLEKIFQLNVSLESARRPPTERLLDPDIRTEVDPDRRERYLAGLRRLPRVEAGDLTDQRRDAGFDTMAVPAEDLAALRAAVRVRRSELLSGRSPDVIEAERRVLAALRLTPRAVKRFDNTFRLQLQVAANTTGSELDYRLDDLVALAKWTALRMFHPQASAAVSSRVGLWDELESLALAGDDEGFRAAVAELGERQPTRPDGLQDLLAVGLPEASFRRLPLETFAGVV